MSGNERMLKTFYGFNLPDWWWLIRLVRSGASGVIMPILVVPATARLVIKETSSGERT